MSNPRHHDNWHENWIKKLLKITDFAEIRTVDLIHDLSGDDLDRSTTVADVLTDSYLNFLFYDTSIWQSLGIH